MQLETPGSEAESYSRPSNSGPSTSQLHDSLRASCLPSLCLSSLKWKMGIVGKANEMVCLVTEGTLGAWKAGGTRALDTAISVVTCHRSLSRAQGVGKPSPPGWVPAGSSWSVGFPAAPGSLSSFCVPGSGLLPDQTTGGMGWQEPAAVMVPSSGCDARLPPVCAVAWTEVCRTCSWVEIHP